MKSEIPSFRTLSYQQRYNQRWYCVKAQYPDTMKWIRDQPHDQWMEIHGRIDKLGFGIDGRRFLIDERLYSWLTLRWA